MNNSPNIFLLIIDGFRADRCFGEKKTSITPNLDKILKEGTLFAENVTAAPVTIPSMSSTITSLYPFRSVNEDNALFNLNPNVENYIKKLHEIGYNTYATVPESLMISRIPSQFVESESFPYTMTSYNGLGKQIVEKIEFEDSGRKISIEPNDSGLEVEFQLNYLNNIIGKQKNSINFSNDNLESIYTSRTFCLFQDIEKIKKLGLAKGGSLDNAIVVDEDKVVNKEGLRNKKEFVNHKILDLAGDFLLSGYRILGKVNCYQGGHQLSNMFLRKLLNSKSSFVEVEINDIELGKKPQINSTVKIAVNA